MADAIDLALAGKLDSFTVPPLPPGFGARVAAEALALPSAPESASHLPRLRSRRGRLVRAGLAGFGALAVGMMSISAAAMGYFGEPVAQAVHRAPVIGKVIEKVIPERRQHKTVGKVHRKQQPERRVVRAPEPALVPETAPGWLARRAEVRERLEQSGPVTPREVTREIRRERRDRIEQWRADHPDAPLLQRTDRPFMRRALERRRERLEGSGSQNFEAPALREERQLTPRERFWLRRAMERRARREAIEQP